MMTDRATAHVIERAKERFDLDLSPEDVEALALECREDRAVVVRRAIAENPVEYRLAKLRRLGDVFLVVVYRVIDQKVVTVLPKTSLFRGDGKHGKMGKRLGRIRKRRERRRRRAAKKSGCRSGFAK